MPIPARTSPLSWVSQSVNSWYPRNFNYRWLSISILLSRYYLNHVLRGMQVVVRWISFEYNLLHCLSTNLRCQCKFGCIASSYEVCTQETKHHLKRVVWVPCMKNFGTNRICSIVPCFVLFNKAIHRNLHLRHKQGMAFSQILKQKILKIGLNWAVMGNFHRCRKYLDRILLQYETRTSRVGVPKILSFYAFLRPLHIFALLNRGNKEN